MRIHTDHNGVAVNAISSINGADVNGRVYQVLIGAETVDLEFQLGPVKEAGVNGLTNEALLAVLTHRLGVLNKAFPCRENALAITKIEEAQLWLEKRTRDRLARGVEGTHAA